MIESINTAHSEAIKYNEEMVQQVSGCFTLQGDMENHIREALLSPESVVLEDSNEEKAMNSLALATDDADGLAKCAHLYRQLDHHSSAAFACIRRMADIIKNNPNSTNNYKDLIAKL